MRLDSYLVNQGYFRSRERAKEAILNGECFVNGKPISKTAFIIKSEDIINLRQPDFDFVSRGGLKLDAALKAFQIDVNQYIALDVGTATGGFTDCLLKNGARLVFALDIGKGQLAKSLHENPKVIFMNNTDIRKVTTLDFKNKFQSSKTLLNLEKIFTDFDLIVIDVSFISVLNILESLKTIANSSTQFVFLIKPQFEYGKKHDGVIKDQRVLDEILQKVRAEFKYRGFKILAEIYSPILGKEGNQEFLWHCKLE